MTKINEDETVAEPASEPAPNAYQMANLIGSVVDQKPSEFATTFDQIMKDRISQKIADRKAELSRDAFATASVADDEPEADEPDEEPEVQEPDENGEPVEEPEKEDEPIDDTEEEQPPPELAKTEEVKPINELGAKILGKYVKGASDSARTLSFGAGLGMGGSTRTDKYRTNPETARKRFDKSEKRQTGINRASDRLVKLAKEDMSDSDKKKVNFT